MVGGTGDRALVAVALLCGCGDDPGRAGSGGGAGGAADAATSATVAQAVAVSSSGAQGSFTAVGPGGGTAEGGASASGGGGGAGGGDAEGGGGAGTGPSTTWARMLVGTELRPQLYAHPDGGVVVVGTFNERLSGSGGPDLTARGLDLFVVRLDDDGQHLSSVSLGLPGAYGGGALVDPTGALSVLVWTEGAYSFAGVEVPERATAMLKLDPEGAPAWATVLDDGTIDAMIIDSAAFGPTGAVLVSGSFTDEIAVGEVTLTPDTDVASFVASLDPETGAFQWVTEIDGTEPSGAVYPTSVTARGDEIVVGGNFDADVVLGGTLHTSEGGYDAFLLALDPATGEPLRATTVGGAEGNEGIAFVAGGPDGSLAIGGTTDFYSDVDFGAGQVVHWSRRGIYVVVLEADDSVRWQGGYAEGTEYDSLNSLRMDPGGSVTISGSFDGSVDFGGGELDGTQGADPTAYFATFDAGGAHVQSWACVGGYTQGTSATTRGRLFGVVAMAFDPTSIDGIALQLPEDVLTVDVIVGFDPPR